MYLLRDVIGDVKFTENYVTFCCDIFPKCFYNNKLVEDAVLFKDI